MIEGVLKYYPKLKEKVQITYVDFETPRTEIVKLVGENYQGCPVLIIHKNDIEKEDLEMIEFKTSNDYYFLYKNTTIAQYFARKYEVGFPH